MAAAEAVADFDSDEVVCPACATPFANTVTRCPECGLNFGG